MDTLKYINIIIQDDNSDCNSDVASNDSIYSMNQVSEKGEDFQFSSVKKEHDRLHQQYSVLLSHSPWLQNYGTTRLYLFMSLLSSASRVG